MASSEAWRSPACHWPTAPNRSSSRSTYTTSDQFRAEIAADPSGNFVVVWTSDLQDGSDNGIFGQRYDSEGVALGSEFRVNTYTTGGQGGPVVSADAGGNFVVVWESRFQDGSGFGIFGQRYDSAGGRLGSEFRVNTHRRNNQTLPSVASDAIGNFVVVWASISLQGGDYYSIFGQRYDSGGTPQGGEFRVNTYTPSDQRYPSVAPGANGGFVVVWSSRLQDGDYYGIFGQRYDSTGAPVGEEFRVNSYTPGDQHRPSVSSDAGGNFVVVWESVGQDGDGFGIFGQRFDSGGQARGNEFQVNSFTTNSQDFSSVASDASGNFTVVWNSALQDGSAEGVFGQQFDSTGDARGGEFQVNSFTTSFQDFPSVAATGANRFVVVWSSTGQDGDGDGVFGRRLRRREADGR